MESNLCINCHKNPIHNKKRGLCYRCYNHFAYTGKLDDFYPAINKEPSHIVELKEKHFREIEFIKNFFKHTDYVHHPTIFRLNGLTYEIDFYDGKRNTFIEVSGTRQAYHANKHKYDLFRELYPKLNFEIRKPSGVLLNEATRNKHW